MDLMWYLVLAHLIGDYALQSDRMAARKRKEVGALSIHVLIYVIVIAAALWVYSRATGSINFWTWAVAGLIIPLYVVHWTQDFVKSRFFSSRQAYYQDQALHVIQLFVIRWLVS